jgi:hypothetical protein
MQTTHDLSDHDDINDSEACAGPSVVGEHGATPADALDLSPAGEGVHPARRESSRPSLGLARGATERIFGDRVAAAKLRAWGEG